jgi:DnaJ-class molecular chaperone
MDQDKAFNILGIPVTSNESEIKKAYRKASLKTHPDRVPGDPTAIRRFQDLSDAYEIALKSLQNKSSNMFPGGRETVDVENIFRAFTTGDNIHEIFAKMSGNLHKTSAYNKECLDQSVAGIYGMYDTCIYREGSS